MILGLKRDFLVLFQCIIDIGSEVFRELCEGYIPCLQTFQANYKHKLFHEWDKKNNLCCECPVAGCNYKKNGKMDHSTFEKLYKYDNSVRPPSGHHIKNGCTDVQQCICKFVANSNSFADFDLSDMFFILKFLNVMTPRQHSLAVEIMTVRGKVCHAVKLEQLSQSDLDNLWIQFENATLSLAPLQASRFIKKHISDIRCYGLKDSATEVLLQMIHDIIVDSETNIRDTIVASENRTNEYIMASGTRTNENIVASEIRTEENIVASENRTNEHIVASGTRTNENILASEIRTGENIVASENRTNEHIVASGTRTEENIVASETRTKEKIGEMTTRIGNVEIMMKFILSFIIGDKTADELRHLELNMTGEVDDHSVVTNIRDDLNNRDENQVKQECEIKSVTEGSILIEVSASAKIFQSERTLQEAIKCLVERLLKAGKVDTKKKASITIEFIITSPLSEDEEKVLRRMLRQGNKEDISYRKSGKSSSVVLGLEVEDTIHVAIRDDSPTKLRTSDKGVQVKIQTDSKVVQTSAENVLGQHPSDIPDVERDTVAIWDDSPTKLQTSDKGVQVQIQTDSKAVETSEGKILGQPPSDISDVEKDTMLKKELELLKKALGLWEEENELRKKKRKPLNEEYELWQKELEVWQKELEVWSMEPGLLISKLKHQWRASRHQRMESTHQRMEFTLQRMESTLELSEYEFRIRESLSRIRKAILIMKKPELIMEFELHLREHQLHLREHQVYLREHQLQMLQSSAPRIQSELRRTLSEATKSLSEDKTMRRENTTRCTIS